MFPSSNETIRLSSWGSHDKPATAISWSSSSYAFSFGPENLSALSLTGTLKVRKLLTFTKQTSPFSNPTAKMSALFGWHLITQGRYPCGVLRPFCSTFLLSFFWSMKVHPTTSDSVSWRSRSRTRKSPIKESAANLTYRCSRARRPSSSQSSSTRCEWCAIIAGLQTWPILCSSPTLTVFCPSRPELHSVLTGAPKQSPIYCGPRK